ncbi:MAG TPA: YMGG-like glycine zipper-containing protein [Acetobacteraceae bacterium]|nr:YMGG-like glycine zipper-containing protein [Acetobacteraceae bacterium]
MSTRNRKSTGRSIATGVLLTGLVLGLSGCGYSRGDRAVSGGLIGAGGGAAIGALTGNPLAGAAIGGAGGALVGAATNPHDVNLGRPVWR